MSTADAYFDRHGYDVDLGDKGSEAAELRHDADALFAIDEARTTFRAAVEAQIKNLTHGAQRDLRMYMNFEADAWSDSDMQARVKAAEEIS